MARSVAAFRLPHSTHVVRMLVHAPLAVVQIHPGGQERGPTRDVMHCLVVVVEAELRAACSARRIQGGLVSGHRAHLSNTPSARSVACVVR